VRHNSTVGETCAIIRGRIGEISHPNRDCGKRAAKSSKPDHTGALLPAEGERVRVGSRITIRREQFSSAARGVGLKRGGSRTLVCVLRKRRSVARGGYEGGLRRLHQPLQVPCVLVAVLLTAAFSLQFIDHAGAPPPLQSADHSCRDESTMAIVSGCPQATHHREISGVERHKMERANRRPMT